jgi:glycosyltransferase involved in cell wall biosynthesis
VLLTIICLIALFFAIFPAAIYFSNIRLYRTPTGSNRSVSNISVLIPARNEEAVIETIVNSALASTSVQVEVIVLDDHSSDRTAELVKQIQACDERVRLISAPPLPDGWNGKQHACHQLSQHAQHEVIVFVDADVTLKPDGLWRMAHFLEESKAALVSGIPRQITGTWLEKLVIPLIHFLLLAFLPMARMRKSNMPSIGAGCGQLFMARKSAYFEMGGHASIKETLHDGIKLPRAFRQHGFMTDLCDTTQIADCRMYHSAQQVWLGLAKNAREGLASTKLIVPFSIMLSFGQILPAVLIWVIDWQHLTQLTACVLSICAIYAVRIDAAFRFRQSFMSALFHPIGVMIVLAIQWFALVRDLIGIKPSWKGRTAHRLTNDPSSETATDVAAS